MLGCRKCWKDVCEFVLIKWYLRLAYCEMYVTLGTFFRRFPKDLEVWKTTDMDMEYDDFFSSYHIEGRNWFQAKRMKP